MARFEEVILRGGGSNNLLFLAFSGPDECGVRPESKPETDDVGQKQEDSGKPGIRLDCFLEKLVIDSRGLREVATTTIAVS